MTRGKGCGGESYESGVAARAASLFEPRSGLPNSNCRWCVSGPLPPSAALPLTEGENKALTL